MEDLFGIQTKRNIVAENISKAFGTEYDEQTIEKGKWAVGMTKQYQGKTWVVSGFNAKGAPLWRVAKDNQQSVNENKKNVVDKNNEEKDLAEIPVNGRIKIDGVGYFKKVSKSDWVKFDPNTGKESDKRINYTKISDNGYAKGVTIIDSNGKSNSSKKEEKQEGKESISRVRMYEVRNTMNQIERFNSKYTDEDKVAVMRTDKGNWDVYYDGKRLGVMSGRTLSEEVAKKMNWYTEDNGRDHSMRSNKKSSGEDVYGKELHTIEKEVKKLKHGDSFSINLSNGLRVEIKMSKVGSRRYVQVHSGNSYASGNEDVLLSKVNEVVEKELKNRKSKK